MKKATVSLFIIFGFVLSACQPKSMSSNEAYYDYAMEEAPAAAPMEIFRDANDGGYMDYEEATTDSGVNTIPEQRLVIRNADLSIVVVEPADAMASISQMAERMNGYVVSSQMWKSTNYNGVEIPVGDVTIRVPSALLDQALDEIKQLTINTDQDVLSENVSGQDVTKEYTDLNSRLKNYEDTEAKLREFMDEAEDTEAALAVFEELAYYTEQIEIIKGQIKYYEESAALSSISVHIQAHEAVNPISVAGWKPSVTVSKALQTLVNAFQAIVDGAIWVVIVIIPVLILIAIPFVALFFIGRAIVRRSRRKKALKSESTPENK